MGHGHEDIGPALKRLREAAGIAQNRLAAKIQRSGANLSRIERQGANPKVASLMRYLHAIDADLGDLDREIREGGSDPLDDAVAAVDQRIREDPTYRELARNMLERFGGPEPSPALRALADLIDRQADQLEDQGRRIRRLEGDASPEGEEPPGSP